LSADGIVITINDLPIADTVSGSLVDEEPGRYVVRALGPDKRLLDQRVVDLAAGATIRVELRVVRILAEPLAPHASGAVDRSRNEREAAGGIAVGLGAVSLVAAGISLAVFESARDRLGQRCPNYRTQPCDSSLRSTIDEGNTAGTLVNVFGVAGLIGLASGIVVLELPAPRAAQASLVISPAGLSATGRF